MDTERIEILYGLWEEAIEKGDPREEEEFRWAIFQEEN